MAKPTLIRLPGTDGPDISIERDLLGRAKIRIGDEVVTPISGAKDAYAIPLPDGTTRTLRLESKRSGLQAIAEDGSTLAIGPVTPTWLTAVMAAPMVLLIGGLLGGLFGAIGVAVNGAISRTDLRVPTKALAMLGVLALAAVLWFVTARAFTDAVNPIPVFTVGDCVMGANTVDSGNGDASGVHKIDCARDHDGEVAGVSAIPGADGSAFPGQAAIDPQAQTDCLAAFESYVGIAYDFSSLDMIFMHPSSDTWDRGDRQLVCIVMAAGGGTLDGTVRGTAQ